MLCNVIHLDPDFLWIEHLDKPSQAQGTSETTYHNYLRLQCTTAFQLDSKRPKCSTHYTQVNTTTSSSSNSNNTTGCGGKGHSQLLPSLQFHNISPNIM